LTPTLKSGARIQIHHRAAVERYENPENRFVEADFPPIPSKPPSCRQSGLFSDADHGMIRDQFRAFIWTHCRGALFSIHYGDMT